LTILYRFDEKHTATEYFGEQLRKAGYNYYGNEPMYSGVTGEEFHADIYMGVCFFPPLSLITFELIIFVKVVYYQRLRHMVKDKFQVRSIMLSSSHHFPLSPLLLPPLSMMIKRNRTCQQDT
jgi:DNA-directed RNA polymerase beta subunit